MRIHTTGNKAYRKDVIDQAARLWESSKTDAVINSCLFTSRMVENLDQAKDHPHMTPELAAVLSTDQVRIKIESSLEVD